MYFTMFFIWNLIDVRLIFMVTRKETNLSGGYKGPDDVNLLVRCLRIQNVHKEVVEGDKGLSCTSHLRMPGSYLLRKIQRTSLDSLSVVQSS